MIKARQTQHNPQPQSNLSLVFHLSRAWQASHARGSVPSQFLPVVQALMCHLYIAGAQQQQQQQQPQQQQPQGREKQAPDPLPPPSAPDLQRLLAAAGAGGAPWAHEWLIPAEAAALVSLLDSAMARPGGRLPDAVAAAERGIVELRAPLAAAGINMQVLHQNTPCVFMYRG